MAAQRRPAARRTPRVGVLSLPPPELADPIAESAMLRAAAERGADHAAAVALGVSPGAFTTDRRAALWQAISAARQAAPDPGTPLGLLAVLDAADVLGLEVAARVGGSAGALDELGLDADAQAEGRWGHLAALPGMGRALALRLRGLELARLRWRAQVAGDADDPERAAQLYAELAASISEVRQHAGADWQLSTVAEPEPQRAAPSGQSAKAPRIDPHTLPVQNTSARIAERQPFLLAEPGYLADPVGAASWQVAHQDRNGSSARIADLDALAVLARVPHRGADGRVTGYGYGLRFGLGDQAVDVIADDAEIADASLGHRAGVPLPPRGRALTAVHGLIRQLATFAPVIEPVPAWAGDALVIPPPEYGAAGIGDRPPDATGVEPSPTWRRITELAAEHPRVGLVIGAAVTSPYLRRLGQEPYVLHLVGDSSLGKSSAQLVAGAVVGDPRIVVRCYNSTALGVGEMAAGLGVLPLILDELGAANLPEPQVEALVFRAVAGFVRTRAKRSGGATTGGGWCGVLIGSGNARLAPASANPGLAPRVVNLDAPITASAAAADELRALALRDYGLPLAAIVADPDPAGMRARIERVEAQIGADLGGVAGRIARHLAAAVAGAEWLAEWTGVPQLGPAVLAEAQRIAEVTEAQRVELGASVGERLLEALRVSAYTRPSAFPMLDAIVGSAERGERPWEPGSGFLGFRCADGGIALSRGVLARIAADAGIADAGPGIDEWDRRGMLQRGDGAHRDRRPAKGWPRLVTLTGSAFGVDADPDPAPDPGRPGDPSLARTPPRARAGETVAEVGTVGTVGTRVQPASSGSHGSHGSHPGAKGSARDPDPGPDPLAAPVMPGGGGGEPPDGPPPDPRTGALWRRLTEPVPADRAELQRRGAELAPSVAELPPADRAALRAAFVALRAELPDGPEPPGPPTSPAAADDAAPAPAPGDPTRASTGPSPAAASRQSPASAAPAPDPEPSPDPAATDGAPPPDGPDGPSEAPPPDGAPDPGPPVAPGAPPASTVPPGPPGALAAPHVAGSAAAAGGGRPQAEAPPPAPVGARPRLAERPVVVLDATGAHRADGPAEPLPASGSLAALARWAVERGVGRVIVADPAACVAVGAPPAWPGVRAWRGRAHDLAHPWAALPAGWRFTGRGQGLAPYLGVRLPGGRCIALDVWPYTADLPRVPRDGPTVAAALAALAAAGLPWQGSPQRTFRAALRRTPAYRKHLAGTPADPCPPARDGAIEWEPAWARPLEAADGAFLHTLDRRMAYAAAANGCCLPVGPAVALDADARGALGAGPLPAGYFLARWPVADPGTFDPCVPTGGDPHRWLATPAAEWARKHGGLPPIEAAFVYPAAHRWLDPVIAQLRRARDAVVYGDHPDAVRATAERIVGLFYKQGIGGLGRRGGTPADPCWRPEARHFVVAENRVRLAAAIARMRGRPVFVEVDAVGVASPLADAAAAGRAAQLPIGDGPGAFAAKGSVPCAAVAAAFAGPFEDGLAMRGAIAAVRAAGQAARGAADGEP